MRTVGDEVLKLLAEIRNELSHHDDGDLALDMSDTETLKKVLEILKHSH